MSLAMPAHPRAEVLDVLRAEEKFLLVTHEHPDVDPDDLPLPYEYRFLTLDSVVGAVPADLGERILVVLDCGNLDRNPFAASLPAEPRPRILNIDHHHDNTCFGSVNLVDAGASCTAEIVWDLMRE